MIKELIKDLSYGNITLEQGLMRAKLIAFEIENEEFKSWIGNELNGYTHEDDIMPSYRIFPCDVVATIEVFGSPRKMPFDVTNLDDEMNGAFYKTKARQSIPLLEENLKASKGEQFGYEELPQPMVVLLRNMANDESIIGVQRKIQFSHIAHIINVTRQKLIDTLLELNFIFPDMQNNFENNQENKDRASTIINTNIYGDNSSSNIGIGDNFSQTVRNTYEQKIEKFISELEKIGIPNEDIAEIREIVSSEINKTGLSKKLMIWVGKMATKAVEKGIDYQVPVLIEKINDFL